MLSFQLFPARAVFELAGRWRGLLCSFVVLNFVEEGVFEKTSDLRCLVLSLFQAAGARNRSPNADRLLRAS